MVKLKKGEMTETPVKTQFGWHIIKLEDTREAQVPAARGSEAADPAAPGPAEARASSATSIRAKAKTDYKFSNAN